MQIVVFEDRHVSKLYPITTGRLTFTITCASFRLVDWLYRLEQPLAAIVRPHLSTIHELDFPNMERYSRPYESDTLLVNARVVPSRDSFETISGMIRSGRCGVVKNGSEIAAALVPGHSLQAIPEGLDVEPQIPVDEAALDRLPTLGSHLDLFQYPHDVVRFNESTFTQNIEWRLANGSYREIRDGVFLAPGATIGEHVVADTHDGPIILDQKAKIGPYCFLQGPAYVGPSSRVIEHSAIKESVSIGHTAKIGGEVEASVVEPFTNKQHHGFLGHSYLGSWINLGAGTCNSDLKNTYGEVKMEYRGERVATGMQFVGCIMGDYSKSAINTGIFTGKTIGVCSMLYGFVTTNVPSYVNYARLFGQVTEMSPQVMIATQARMFERRNVTQRPCDIQLLQDMYELTRFDRQIAGEPLSL